MPQRVRVPSNRQGLRCLYQNGRTSWTQRKIRPQRAAGLSTVDFEAFEPRILLSVTPEGLNELLAFATVGSEEIKITEGNSADFQSGAVAIHPFVQLEPSGGLIFTSRDNTGTISSPGDREIFTLDMDQGQTITVIIDPDSTLRPAVELADAEHGSIGSAAGGVSGADAVLQSIPVPHAGTYTIAVSGLSGTTGGYAMQIILNAAAEHESHDGPANDSMASAQDLDDRFVPVGVDVGQSGAVVGRVANPAIGPDAFGYRAVAVPFDFEDISTTGAPVLVDTDDSVVQLTEDQLADYQFEFYGTTHTNLFVGSNGLITFGTPNESFANTDLALSPLQASIAPLWDDLVTFGSADAVYWQVRGQDDQQRLIVQWNDVNYIDSQGGDQITFQAVLSEADGSIRFNYLDLETVNGVGSEAASATVGIKNTGPQIDQRLLLVFDDGPNDFVGSGRSTVIGVDVPATSDWYSFSLQAGQSATLALSGQDSDDVTLELYDSASTLLAVGSHAVNVDQVITDFVADQSGTYFAQVIGSDTDYGLVVTRQMSFDTEPNNGVGVDAQDITVTKSVMGTVSDVVLPITTETEPNDDGSPGGSIGDLVHANDVTGSFVKVDGDAFRAVFTGEIGSGGDVDWDFFKITTAPGDTLEVQLRGSISGSGTLEDPLLRLFDNTGVQIAVNDDFFSLESLINFSEFTYVGDYYIVADSFGASTGTYTVTATLTTVNPPSVNDDDFYRFQATAGDTVAVDVHVPSAGTGQFTNGLDVAVELFDPAGVPVAFDSSGSLSHTATTTGTYTVKVLAENDSRGQYILTVTPNLGQTVAANRFERLRPLGGLVSVSGNNSGHLGSAGQTDRFEFFLEGGQLVSAIATPEDPTATLSLAFGGRVVSAQAPGQAVVLDVIAAPFDRTAAVAVSGDMPTSYSLDIFRNASLEALAGDSSDGNELAIDESFMALGSGRYGVIGSSDPEDISLLHEPNDTIAQAVFGLIAPDQGVFADSGQIGDNPNLSVDPGLDVDLIRLDLGTGDRLKVDVDAHETGSSLDPVLRLFNSDGKALVLSDDEPAPGEPFTLDPYIDFTAAVADTYFIGVSGFANVGYDPLIEGSGSDGLSTGPYGITIEVEAPPTVPSGPLGENIGFATPTELIVNGGFETGDFTGWTATTNGLPELTPWTVGPAGGGFFGNTTPSAGQFDAYNGFDGQAGLEYELYQDVTIPAGTQATLTTNHRMVYDSLGIASVQDRVLEISIRDTNNVLLDTLYTEDTTINGGFFTDLGWNTQNFDVSQFAGQTVRIHFHQRVPESFTGPANIEFDDISLIVQAGGGFIFPDVDLYTVDLTGKVGQRIDVVLTGLEGADFSDAALELLDTDGVTILGTANSAGLTNGQIANVDLGILGFTIPADGRYTLRLTAEIEGDYSLILTESLAFDTESSDTPVNLDNALGALGFLGGQVEPSRGSLYGSSSDGQLFVIDLATGTGIPVGQLPTGSTEIECNPVNNDCFVQDRNGTFTIQQFDIATGAAIGQPVSDGAAFNGLEFVDGRLFGTAISSPGSPSDLRVLDPLTGVSTVIGPTGVGPMAGLAWDTTNRVMFGIDGGPGPATLYTVDLLTGAATPVGSIGGTGIQAGSMEFGPDGELYAGGTGSNAGRLYKVDPIIGTAQFVGLTGFGSVTGLALGPVLAEVSSNGSASSVAHVGGYPGFLVTGPEPWVRRLDGTGPQERVVVVDDPDLHEIAPGTGFDGVVDLTINTIFGTIACSGSLLSSGTHILTAAHCLTDDFGNLIATSASAGFDLINGPVTLAADQFFVHPSYDGNSLHGFDIAIIQLASTAPAAADRYDIYRGSDEIGRVGFRVGYGLTGTGNSGDTGSAGVKRGGENRYDALADIWEGVFFSGINPGTQLGVDFDSGLPVSDSFGAIFDITDLGQGLNEVNSASGDSGGPVFINGQIAGVTSYGFSPGFPFDVVPGINSSFGEFSGDTRVSVVADWIDGIVADSLLVGPSVISIDPPAGQTAGVGVTQIHIEFSETITSDSALDAGNYQLLFAGANGVFEGGTGDDELLAWTVVFDGDRTVDLNLDPAHTPLAPGLYRLTLDGDSSIVDLDGNPLNSTTGPAGGSDEIHVFEIAANPESEGDTYQITLDLFDTLVVSTRTLLDHVSGQPLNDLDPRLVILDAAGTPLASDNDSASDGKNAQLRFFAPQAGVYLVQVRAESGSGEYMLDIDIQDPLEVVVEDVQVTGSASEVVSGFFDLSFRVPEQIAPLLAAYNVELALAAQNTAVVLTGAIEAPGAIFPGRPPLVLALPDSNNVLRVADNLPGVDQENPIVDRDKLFRVTFDVQPGFVGDFEVDVDFTQLQLFDGLGSTVGPVRPVAGTITVIDPPPKVTDVLVSGSTWTDSFLHAVDPIGALGYSIPVGSGAQLETLPWVNIDRISARFSEDVTIGSDNLSLRGVNIPAYGFSSFGYDSASRLATWTLDLATQPGGVVGIGADKLVIDLADAVHDAAGNALDGEWDNPGDVLDPAGVSYPSGDGHPGGDFLFRFNVLPGNTDRGLVTAGVLDNDVVATRHAQFQLVGDEGYSAFLDVDASGSIFGNDVILVRNRLFTDLPSGQPSQVTDLVGDASGPNPLAFGGAVIDDPTLSLSAASTWQPPRRDLALTSKEDRGLALPEDDDAFSLTPLLESPDYRLSVLKTIDE